MIGEFASAVIIIMELAAFTYLNDAYFELKSQKKLLLINSVIAILQSLFLKYTPFLPIVNSVVGFFFLLTISLIAYNNEWRKKVFLTAVFLVCNIALDLLVVFININIFSMAYTEILQNFTLYMSLAITSKLILILVTYYLKCKLVSKRKNKKLSMIQLTAALAFSLYTFLNLYATMSDSFMHDEINVILIFNSIAIIGCNILLFYIIDQLEEENELKSSANLLKQQVKIEMENYTELSKAYAAQRTLTHDFNNHLSIIQSLINSDETLQAQRYINNILGKSNVNMTLVNTNNPIIDALLTQKYYLAKSKNVEIQIISSDLLKLPIKTEDLVILLLNLIDNAIEAAAICENEKIVKIRIVEEENEFIFSVQNTTVIKSEKLNDEFKTTKLDYLNHGFGFKIIKSILKKYKLDYSISVYDGWFRFSFLMQF